MKILYDTKIFQYQIFGGISLYFAKLFSEYNNDSQVDYVIPYLYSDNYYIKGKSFSPKIRLYPKPFLFKKQIIKFLNTINHIRTIVQIKLNNFDIFHPTYIDDYYLNILKKPYVITVHDMTVERLPEYFIFDKQMNNTIQTKKNIIAKASRIIAVSENTKKDIIELCNIDESKIDVVYHAQSFEMNNSKEEYEEVTLPKKYILYVGNRAKYKNFVNFIVSISDTLKNDKKLYLVLAGGGNSTKSESELISNLGIENKIIKVPIQTDKQLISYYKNALCFVFPSLYEGFGFPILEAFQCECPLICSDTSCFPEIAQDGAVYFNPYSSESIKTAVEKVLNDENLRKEMVINGKKQFERFSWQKAAQQTKEVYIKVLNG